MLQLQRIIYHRLPLIKKTRLIIIYYIATLFCYLYLFCLICGMWDLEILFRRIYRALFATILPLFSQRTRGALPGCWTMLPANKLNDSIASDGNYKGNNNLVGNKT